MQSTGSAVQNDASDATHISSEEMIYIDLQQNGRRRVQEKQQGR